MYSFWSRRLLKTKTKDVFKTSSSRRMFAGFIFKANSGGLLTYSFLILVLVFLFQYWSGSCNFRIFGINVLWLLSLIMLLKWQSTLVCGHFTSVAEIPCSTLDFLPFRIYIILFISCFYAPGRVNWLPKIDTCLAF